MIIRSFECWEANKYQQCEGKGAQTDANTERGKHWRPVSELSAIIIYTRYCSGRVRGRHGCCMKSAIFVAHLPSQIEDSLTHRESWKSSRGCGDHGCLHCLQSRHPYDTSFLDLLARNGVSTRERLGPFTIAKHRQMQEGHKNRL